MVLGYKVEQSMAADHLGYLVQPDVVPVRREQRGHEVSHSLNPFPMEESVRTEGFSMGAKIVAVREQDLVRGRGECFSDLCVPAWRVEGEVVTAVHQDLAARVFGADVPALGEQTAFPTDDPDQVGGV